MMYRYINTVALVFVPFAPMIYFGWRVYKAALAETGIVWLAIVAAIVTVIGLEVTGILAGHYAMAFWRLGDNRRAILSASILGIYILIGIYELSDGFTAVTIGSLVFVIAPLVYILSALGEVLEHESAAAAAADSFDSEQKAKDADHQRALELRNTLDQTAVKLAQTKANEHVRIEREKAKVTAVSSPQVSVSSEKVNGKLPEGFTDWRPIPLETKLSYAQLTPDEIHKLNPKVTKRTAENWKGYATELASKKQHVNGSNE